MIVQLGSQTAISPPLDANVGPIFVFFGVLMGMGLLVAAIVIEAASLRLLNWGSPIRSAVASIVVNLISTASGIIVARLPQLGLFQWLTLGLIEHKIVSYIFAWAVTVVIEAPVLWLFRRTDFRRTVAVAAKINLVSYLFIYLFVLLFFRWLFNG